ncbi:MAG: Wzz/FepE/Etk N-terminal domain-containing protein, partial [Caulobacterales bacterium]|nr:Wzz/FepE/Etk N-terminal domain-containing protein [Caulobacterales bacterium]
MKPELWVKPGARGGAMNNALDVRRILELVRRRLLFMVTMFVLFLIVGAVVVNYLPLVYESRVKLLIEASDDATDIVSTSGVDFIGRVNINNQVEIMQSVAFMERIIEKHGVDSIPGAAAVEFDEEAAAAYLAQRAATSGTEAGLDTSISEEEIVAWREKVMVRQLLENLSVRLVTYTDVAEMSFRASDPTVAADTLNLIAEEFLLDTLDARYEAVERANAWLSRRLNELRLEVEVAEEAILQFASENEILEDLEKDGTLVDQRAVQTNQQLIEAQAEEARLRTRRARLQRMLADEADLSDVSRIANSELMGSLRAERATLLRRLSDLRTRYRDEHPQILSTQGEIAQLDEQVRSEAARIVAEVGEELAAARARVAVLQAENEDVADLAASNSYARLRLRELERRADNARTLYDNFLERFNAINQTEELSSTTNARILSRATPPDSPDMPSKIILYLACAAVAGAATIGLTLLIELLPRGVQSRDDVEDLFNVRVLGTVPLSQTRALFKRSPEVQEFITQKGTIFSESITSLRSAITTHQIGRAKKVQTIAITSSLPGEGKTVVAASAAISSAESGKRTLLIDCDMRLPRVHDYLGMEKRPKVGFVDYLAGKCDIASVVQ